MPAHRACLQVLFDDEKDFWAFLTTYERGRALAELHFRHVRAALIRMHLELYTQTPVRRSTTPLEATASDLELGAEVLTAEPTDAGTVSLYQLFRYGRETIRSWVTVCIAVVML